MPSLGIMKGGGGTKQTKKGKHLNFNGIRDAKAIHLVRTELKKIYKWP